MIDSILLIILGMSLATMLPRYLPVWIVDRFIMPNWVKSWLSYIPYAALGALLFPGILTIEEGEPWIGIIGGITAACLVLLRLNILFVILGSVLIVILLKQLM
ncbi:AzlD domain-containing protein [Chengkuizengella sediminis]|uniref:AzlD domain-containing protein n=1 Tax=Chengkuizengella sediminis TaxID=1885917 RepID=UPI00138A4019|nr:AzlD domain-containing protein [Chengkuizengella sediminis]NDI34253.1 AzlD domain-containing protein [Chengkuizengella sediminis]